MEAPGRGEGPGVQKGPLALATPGGNGDSIAAFMPCLYGLFPTVSGRRSPRPCPPKGLPQAAKALSGMSEKDFLKTIGGKRGDYGKRNAEEKQSALGRFQAMKDHIAVVDEWNDEPFNKATTGLYQANV